MNTILLRSLVTSLCLMAATASAQRTPSDVSPPVAPPKAKPEAEAPITRPAELKLPGLVVNSVEHSVDVDAAVCLEKGTLEFIACTKDTKEHESFVVVEARPIHIHTALLLLGAKNGNPSMRKPINEDNTRWVDIPPRGDSIDVFLAWKNEEGKMVERPIGDFVKRVNHEASPAPRADAKGKEEPFPRTFVFAGSLLGDPAETPRRYLADTSGHVISISTFGDEVLCLPAVHSQDNGSLMWEVDSTHLPKVDAKVILRLRVKKKP